MENYTLIFPDAQHILPLSLASALGGERQRTTLVALADEKGAQNCWARAESHASVIAVQSLKGNDILEEVLADSVALIYFDDASLAAGSGNSNLQCILDVSRDQHVCSLIVSKEMGQPTKHTAWVHVPTTVGPGCTSNIIHQCLIQLFQGRVTVELPESGEKEESFLHVADAAIGIARLVRHAEYEGETYEFRSNRASVSSVMKFLLFHLGLEGQVAVRYNTSRPDMQILPVPEHRAVEQLGFKPRFTLRKGIALTVDWFESSFGPILPRSSSLAGQP